MECRLELSETTCICGWAVTHTWNSRECFQKGRIWSDPYQQDLTENSYVLGWSSQAVRSGTAFGQDFGFEVGLGQLKAQ